MDTRSLSILCNLYSSYHSRTKSQQNLDQWATIGRRIQSFLLSPKARLELFCQAVVDIEESVASVLLQNGFDSSTTQALEARDELIQLTKSPDSSELFHVKVNVRNKSIVDPYGNLIEVKGERSVREFSVVSLPLNEEKQVLITVLSRRSRWVTLHIDVLCSVSLEERIAFLLRHGANCNETQVCSFLLMVCATVGGRERITELLQIRNECEHRRICSNSFHEEALELLLKHNAALDATDHVGESAIHNLAAAGCEQCVKMLLQNGANMNLVNKDGSTPLHSAAARGRETIVRLLKDNAAKEDQSMLNKRDRRNRSALFLASENGHLEVVRTLLDYEVDVNITDSDGSTALCAAIKKQFGEIVKLLLTYGADPELKDNRGLSAIQIVVFSKPNISDSLFTTRSLLNDLFYQFCVPSSSQSDVMNVRTLLEYGAEIQTLHKIVKTLGSPITFRSGPLRVVLEYVLVEEMNLINWLVDLLDTRFHGLKDYGVARTENEAFFILHHFIKLQAAGFLPFPLATCDVKCALEDRLAQDDMKEIRTQCKEEVALMAETIPGCDVTFWEFLSKSADHLAVLSENKEVVRGVESASCRFPLYEGILLGRLERGRVRRRWIRAASCICHRIFNQVRRIPHEIIEEILVHLTDGEMRRFVVANERYPGWKLLQVPFENELMSPTECQRN